MLARAIHNSSRRAAGRLHRLQFRRALSDTLLDSQLFGHEKGAFTGAMRRVKGKFEQADGGTLFIDEIADMSATAQAKILRAVEYGEFERLGSESAADGGRAAHLAPPTCRSTATSRPITSGRISSTGSAASRSGCRHSASGPKDLRTLMATEIAAAAAAQGKTIVGVSREAADQLLQYGWPGNLRELKRVMHTAVAVTDGEIIEPDAILLETSVEEVRAEGAAAPTPAASSSALDEDHLSLRAAEARHIHQVLDHFRGNKRRSAKALGLSRSTLDRKLSEH